MDESPMTLARMISASSTSQPATPSPTAPVTMPSLSVSDFDVEAFLHHFEGFEMTEQEKREVLHMIWEIMCRFVEVGFGLDSHSM